MIFEDIANVMNARPVKEIMRKTGLTKNRVYSLRMGCTFHMDYELLFALQRMGYEVRVVGRGATLERSESGVGQNIGPGGASDRPRVFAEQNGGGSRRAPGCERGATASGAWRGSEHAGPGACSHSAAFRLRRKRPGRRTRPGRDGCVSDEVYGLLRSGRASRSKALSSCSGAGTWAEASSAFR